MLWPPLSTPRASKSKHSPFSTKSLTSHQKLVHCAPYFVFVRLCLSSTFLGCFDLCIFPNHVYVWYHLLLLHLNASKCSLHYFVFRLFTFPAILFCPDLYSHHPVYFCSYLDSTLPFCLPFCILDVLVFCISPLPPPQKIFSYPPIK